MASTHALWLEYVGAHEDTIKSVTDSWNLVNTKNKKVRHTSYRYWYKNPNDGVGENTRRLIETTVTAILQNQPIPEMVCPSVEPSSRDCSVEPLQRDISCVPLEAMISPEDGLARDEWRSELRMFDRTGSLYRRMQELNREITIDRMKRGTGRSEGNVYIMIDPGKEKQVKIGVAIDPKSRKASLRGIAPDLIVVCHFFTVDSYGVENLAHRAGRLVERSNPHPSNERNEMFRLSWEEATVLIVMSKMIVEEELIERLRPSVSRTPEDRKSVTPSVA